MRTHLTVAALAPILLLWMLHDSSAAIVIQKMELDGTFQPEDTLGLLNKAGEMYGHYESKRIQRDVSTETTEVVKPNETADKNEDNSNIVVSVPSKKPSVLVLIRDALKKVTSGFPTTNQQLDTTNALQYFTLFENFLQQTIEEVIGNDEDEEEVSTVKNKVEESTTDSHIPEAITQSVIQQIKDGDKEISEMENSKPSETLEQMHIQNPVTASATNQ